MWCRSGNSFLEKLGLFALKFPNSHTSSHRCQVRMQREITPPENAPQNMGNSRSTFSYYNTLGVKIQKRRAPFGMWVKSKDTCTIAGLVAGWVVQVLCSLHLLQRSTYTLACVHICVRMSRKILFSPSFVVELSSRAEIWCMYAACIIDGTLLISLGIDNIPGIWQNSRFPGQWTDAKTRLILTAIKKFEEQKIRCT